MEHNMIIGSFETPNEQELKEINTYTRRSFSADEVYAFSVVLCDNEVDRDFERFTEKALEGLAELFKGVTGIFDHSHKSENQCARIFSCKAERVAGRKNSLGEPYCRLFARAYMPKSDKASELMLQIDAGIKKEVSVGCSMASSTCSVCGKPAGFCTHVKGRHYKNSLGVRKLCFFELSEPKDAYEWSFVAVPAQPGAGVVKSFTGENEFRFFNLTKCLERGRVTLTEQEALQLAKDFESLTRIAVDAGEYLKKQRAEIVKELLPDADCKATEFISAAVERLDPVELFKLKSQLDRKDEEVRSQLAKRPVTAKSNTQNNNFKI